MPRILFAGLAASLACSGAVRAQVTYSLTPVVPPGAGFVTQSFSINAQGDVALTTGNGQTLGTAWVVGPSGTQLLPPLAGQPNALPIDLADSGRVLGGSGPDVPFLRASVWNPLGQVRELRGIPGDVVAFPLCGTGGGWLGGLSSANYGVTDAPVLWVHDVLLPLDLPPGLVYGGVYGMNADATMVGGGWNASQTVVEGWIRYGLGAPARIGQVPGHLANQLLAINTEEVAVGTSLDDAGVQWGLIRDHGALTALPPLPGHPIAVLVSVNRSGVAVGLDLDPSGFPFAVIQQGNQLVWLNELVTPPTGWQLLIAQEVNNAGQIACTGITPQGTIGACVLTPAGSPDGSAAAALPAPIDPALDSALRRSLARRFQPLGPLGARIAAKLAP